MTPAKAKALPPRDPARAAKPWLVVLDLEQTRFGPRLPAQEPGPPPPGDASGV